MSSTASPKPGFALPDRARPETGSTTDASQRDHITRLSTSSSDGATFRDNTIAAPTPQTDNSSRRREWQIDEADDNVQSILSGNAAEEEERERQIAATLAALEGKDDENSHDDSAFGTSPNGCNEGHGWNSESLEGKQARLAKMLSSNSTLTEGLGAARLRLLERFNDSKRP